MTKVYYIKPNTMYALRDPQNLLSTVLYVIYVDSVVFKSGIVEVVIPSRLGYC